MNKKSVKRRIFLSNTWMVLVTLIIFLVINIFVAKVYAETIEREFRVAMEQTVDKASLEKLVEDYTIHRNEFFLLIIIDGILCIAGLIITSRIFTKRLADHMMEPLEVLSDGADRIKNNDLTQEICYEGDTEFENLCETFNGMRKSILEEQERNQKYEKARTDMIAGISHDLRTPLTAIRGSIKAVIDGVAADPKQQEKFLETAYRRTNDMDVLLNQLFYMSKLETGNMPLYIKNINISDFTKNYVKNKQETVDENAIKITEQINLTGDNVLADPEQLCRIFDNLFENSRKYAKTVPLEISIDIKDNGDMVMVNFSDNGAGVPQENLPYIFDEFYRVDESRGKKEGNGLGLYIVKYLVEAMGGKVNATSRDGFCVSMTLKKAEGE